MATYSVNALLSMQTSLRTRLNQLNELKNSSTRTTRFFGLDSGKENRVEEPTYDIKLVDAKIVKINKALFKIDQSIKESNATVKVDVDVDYDDLTSELE